MSRKMSLINRMLLPIAPKTACRREAWAQYGRSFYSAADTGPRAGGWTRSNPTGEQANQGNRDLIRGRSRDQERNSDILNAEILALERNVVGSGFVLQAKVRNAADGDDETLNSQIEEAWREWCRPQNCEVTGRFSFSDLASMVIRRRYTDGGILILKVLLAGRYQLQLLEVDDLDSSVQMFDNHRVVGGIEIDEYRRPVAYFIKVYDEWGVSVKSQRIPADRVVYLPYLTRPSQVREMTPFAPALGRIDDTNELIDASIEKERVLSHLSAVVEKDTGILTGVAGLGRGYYDAPVEAVPGAGPGQPPPKAEILEQGTITYLKPGEKISTIAPAGTSSTVDPIIKTTQRMAGSSIGLSYEAVSRDMSRSTYSSARQGFLEDKRTYMPQQQYLVDHLLDVIYPEWLDWAVLTGRIPIPDYFREPAPYRRHVWIASGWDWIDPAKETGANLTALQTNQKTLQEICAEKGKDWREVLAQRKRETDMLRKLGLDSGLNSAAVPEAPPDQPDDENNDEEDLNDEE
ncbi:Phage portal protein, lambda family [Caprobacter fermentans]|uniref:Phage portal protein, lambda family n=1 Tax=Caproicibacter fermentans TaxID=2576756 RepID=A0A6N8HZW7_9FIRM|nr:phage portal protein [Caproicibacter fermentans]MVB11070.1 Phage portal protein, lambda family [Caproicibacter fermentans]